MHRKERHTPRPLCATLILACVAAAAQAQDDRHVLAARLDLGSMAPSTPSGSWLVGDLGKLRYDEGDRDFTVSRLVVQYDGRLRPTLTARVVADYVDDGDSGVDLTEAYVEWRPVPKSPRRHRLKAGAFFPPLSLENVELAWDSPFSLSSSAINSWIGEELRTLGAEWSMQRALGEPSARRHVRTFASAYFGNDPAGVLLVWRGWALHDRQSRLGDVLPLAPLPQLAPGAMFEQQAPRAEPFLETDDRPGYYVGAELALNRKALLTFTQYDNHADPLSLRDGQYGWSTRFDHVGAQFELSRGAGLVTQWLDGRTAMGPRLTGPRVVDADFDAYFVLLTKSIASHRVSLRYDNFSITDRDGTPLDDNSEVGSAWLVGYRYAPSPRLVLDAEWLEVESTRPARAYFGQAPLATERLLQLQVSVRLGRVGP
jgi:hypothetical protein